MAVPKITKGVRMEERLRRRSLVDISDGRNNEIMNLLWYRCKFREKWRVYMGN